MIEKLLKIIRTKGIPRIYVVLIKESKDYEDFKSKIDNIVVGPISNYTYNKEEFDFLKEVL